MSSAPITLAEVEFFNANGWLLTRPFSSEETAQIVAWVSEVQNWHEDKTNSSWFQYFEMTDDGPKICRSENFIPYHEGLRALLTKSVLTATADLLLGEASVLYKEKINYKLPGGAGYSPHQDAPAYPFVNNHVSCMIAVDDSLLQNGCLEVVSARHQDLLPMDERGCIRNDVVEGFDWQSVEVRAGEVLWFHSLAPHRSGPNNSSHPRRAIYPTYNSLSQGNLRDAYYAEKLRMFQESANDSGRTRVSLIGDFEGRSV